MDILDSAQKQINDAAGEMDPPAEPPPSPIVNSSGSEPPVPSVNPAPQSAAPPFPETIPELPKPETPKELKEEAMLPEPPPPVVTSQTEVPKPDLVKEPNPLEIPVHEPPPAFTPSVPEPEPKSPEPLETTTFGGPPSAEPKKAEAQPTPQEAKPFVPPPEVKKTGGSNKGLLLAGLLLLLIVLPVVVYFVSQQPQLAELRSRASCQSGYFFCGGCINSCTYITTKTCSQLIAERCGGGGGGGAPTPTAARRPSGGGGSTTGLPDSQNSGCCTTNTQCVSWFGSVSTCSNPNGACASGKQCKGGGGTGCHSCLQTDCGVAGCGGQTCNAGCPTKCGNGVCENGETNANCPADCKAPAAATGCGANGAACCDPFSTGGKICNPNLYCNTATGKCQTTPPGNLCASGATAGTNCAVFTCGTRCNNGNQCNLNEQIVSCSSASLGGQCGQIDFLDTTNGYCGVQSQNCGGSCAGGAPPPPSGPSGPAPTPAPALAQCVRVKVYQGTAQIDPTTLKIGDSVTLAVNATNATKGRIRVNGGAFTETTTKNANGEFTVPFTIPSGVTTFTVEAEVFGANGTWQ